MSKSNTAENELLLLKFNNTNIANTGDATGIRGSTVAGSYYLVLHTADPGEAGTATTSEIAYTGYARKAVPRSSAGFTVTGNTVVLAADNDFPKMTGGAGGTVTHWSVVKESAGASVIEYSGAVTPNQLIASGVIPRLEAATNIVED